MLAHASESPKSTAARLPKCVRHAIRCALEAQSRAFNSGAGIDVFAKYANRSAPEFWLEGGGTTTWVVPMSASTHREEVFPAFQDPASERDPRAGLSPISFPKRNGEPSVSGTGSIIQITTDPHSRYYRNSPLDGSWKPSLMMNIGNFSISSHNTPMRAISSPGVTASGNFDGRSQARESVEGRE